MALRGRDTTGRGQVVDLAIIEPILAMLGSQLTVFDQLGIITQRAGNRSENNAPRNTYRTADGDWVAISTSAHSIAERVLCLVGREDLTKEPWFGDGHQRAKHADVLDDAVGSWILQRPTAVVVEEFARAEAALAVVNDMSRVIVDEQYNAIGAIATVEDEDLASYADEATLVVRVNPVGTDDFSADVAALTPLVRAGRVAAVRIAKVDSVDDVQRARSATEAWGPAPRLICQLESAAAIARIHEIANAPGVHSIMLGEADLRADLRLPRGAAGDPGLLLARQSCVLASRAAGLPSPVASAFTDVRDTEGLRESTARMAGLGFVGRSCIHPKQAAVVREAFAPDPSEVAWARSVLTEAGAQETDTSAASVLADGTFVDPAIVRQAERIAARADRVAAARTPGADR